MGRKKGEELCTFYVSIIKDTKEKFEEFCNSRGLIKSYLITKLLNKLLENPDEYLK